jgi:hypothetical protein
MHLVNKNRILVTHTVVRLRNTVTKLLVIIYLSLELLWQITFLCHYLIRALQLGFTAVGLRYIFTTRDCSVGNRNHTHMHRRKNRHEFEEL